MTLRYTNAFTPPILPKRVLRGSAVGMCLHQAHSQAGETKIQRINDREDQQVLWVGRDRRSQDHILGIPQLKLRVRRGFAEDMEAMRGHQRTGGVSQVEEEFHTEGNRVHRSPAGREA